MKKFVAMMLAVAGLAGTSNAAYTVTITGLPGGPIVNSSPDGPDSSAIPASNFTFSGSTGGISYGGTATATEFPPFAQATLSTALNFRNNSTTSTGTLTITIVQDAYDPSALPVPGTGSFTVTALGSPQTTAATGLLFDTSINGFAPPQTNLGSVGGGVSPSNAGLFAVNSLSNPFSITQVFTIGSLIAGQAFQFNANTQYPADTAVVPVPATALVLVGALPLFGMARRRVIGV